MSSFIKVSLLLAAATLTTHVAQATMYDLSASGTQSVGITGTNGVTAVISDYWSQPTGTGVFDPFLTLDANGQTSTGSNYVEQAYNSQGFNALYLDGLRPNWNTTIRVGDLASVWYQNAYYFAFVLDANEPGGSKSVISVDNIRVYTSAGDNTASVGNNISNLDNLGTLRWAMNNTQQTNGSFDVTNWIKLDASSENVGSNSNGGSGMSDMIVYIPQSAFLGASANDYVWLYNLNGVHYTVNASLGATSGFEEWRAVKGKQVWYVPDTMSTAAALAAAFGVMGLLRRRFARK